jgi:uncharacterized membrane protein YpjA
VLLHPGDAYDVVTSQVDVLALPVWAPWAKLSDTVDYLRAVHPAVAVPVHEAPLSSAARDMYVELLSGLCPDTAVVPLEHDVATDLLSDPAG